MIDTGGYVRGSDDIFEDEIAKQVHLAIDEASVILLMTDAQSGVTSMDQEVAQILRRSKKHVLLAVNKVDSSIHEPFTADFYSLGLGAPYSVSAINGSGTGEILDTVVEFFRRDEAEQPSEQADPSEKALPRFAIVGRPNVGKSSLTNALLGKSATSSPISPGRPVTQSIRSTTASDTVFTWWIRPDCAKRARWRKTWSSTR